MPSILLLLTLLLSTALSTVPPKAAGAPPTAADLQNCPTQCGSVSLPYPFNFRRGCYREGFQVECNRSSNAPTIRLPEATESKPTVFVTNMSLDVVTVLLDVVESCNHSIDTQIRDETLRFSLNLTSLPYTTTELGGTPYTLSNVRNKLVVLGCYSTGNLVLMEMEDMLPVSTCLASCVDADFVNGSCTAGLGCCRSDIPMGVKDYVMSVVSTDISGLNLTYKYVSPCSYAFIVDSEQYAFQSSDLYDYYGSRGTRSVPVALDWAIANYSCSVARSSPDYACGGNTHCVNSTNGPGYRCSCNIGYTGNPYLADGCQDINECDDQRMNTCSDICINTMGSFNCSCPVGMSGDGYRVGKGCISNPKRVPLLQIILGSGFGFLLLLLCFTLLYWFVKKRNLIRLRENFFEQNGGLIMRNIILAQDSRTQIAKIFTEDELINATNNYSKKRIIGQGGFGMVYQGTLPNNTHVAIKKSKIEEEGQVGQFINEIVILSQIKHRNVVKILGCCLDSHVPLLVYEYISNGTLFYHLHGRDRIFTLSWYERLRIALEIADAISYLHYFASEPIIHRDIKSSNILLDENCSAKVADFGISKIVPVGQFDETTMLQGTWGYIDPESIETGQLTMKSDVYSFGVILAELLTGQTPIFTRSDKSINLAGYFVESMKENKLFEILETRVRDEGNPDELQVMGNLAIQCLRSKSKERASMREIVAELSKLYYTQIPAMHQSNEELQIAGNIPSSYLPNFEAPQSTGISYMYTETKDSTTIWKEYLR